MIAPEQQEDEEAKYPERELGEEEAKEDEGEAECASEPVMPLPAHKPPRDVPAVELPSGGARAAFGLLTFDQRPQGLHRHHPCLHPA